MSTLVKMFKDGTTLDVHPMVVEEHKKLGWVVQEDAPKPVKEPVKAEEVKPVAKETAKKNK